MRSGPLPRTSAHPQRDRSVSAAAPSMSRRSPRARVAAGLASAFLAGAWTDVNLARRGAVALSHRYRWLRPLAAEVVAAYLRPPADRPRELADWIELNETFRRAWQRARRDRKPEVRHWLTFDPAMGAMRWPVPPFAGVADLGDFLGLEPGQLAWF